MPTHPQQLTHPLRQSPPAPPADGAEVVPPAPAENGATPPPEPEYRKLRAIRKEQTLTPITLTVDGQERIAPAGSTVWIEAEQGEQYYAEFRQFDGVYTIPKSSVPPPIRMTVSSGSRVGMAPESITLHTAQETFRLHMTVENYNAMLTAFARWWLALGVERASQWTSGEWALIYSMVGTFVNWTQMNLRHARKAQVRI